VFLGALAVRVAYWALITPRWVPQADADQYVRLARSLADGRGFGLVFPGLAHHPTAFRPPLYPLLATPGAALFGDALWPIRLLTVLIGSGCAVLAALVTMRIGGRRAGLAAGIAVACYPPLVFNDTLSLTEPLGLALVLAVVLLVDDARWATAGLCLGLAMLTRPNALVALVIIAVYAAITVRPRAAAGLLVCTAAVVTPWMIRNQVQVGTWSMTTSEGLTIAAVYAQPAQRAGTFVDPVFSPAYDDPDHRWAQFDEAGWSSRLRREGLEALRRNPGYVWHVISANGLGYFEIQPQRNQWAEVNDGRRWRVRQAALPLFWVVSVAGLAGLWRFRRQRLVILLAALTAQFVVMSLVLVASPRLRGPFDLACCVGVGLLFARGKPTGSGSAEEME